MIRLTVSPLGKIWDYDRLHRLLRVLLAAVVDLDELHHPRHAGQLLLAAAVEGKGCSDDTVARAASMPAAVVRDVLSSMLDCCLHPALLTARATLKTRSLVCQLAAIDDTPCLIPYITGYLVKFSIRKFFTSDVGQERLSLVPRILEAGELVTDGVAMKAIAVTDVEKVACHGQSGSPGWGTRLPTSQSQGSGETILNYDIKSAEIN